jgi:D-amino-acid oxidase
VKIAVVGAGVIGLTCAVELEAAGHDVTVIGEHTGDATVSSVAGAIWFPYRAGPPDRVARWAARTRARLEALVDVPDAGVAILTCFEITGASPEHDEPPWWLAAAPDAEYVTTDLPGGPRAWRFRAPRVEPARYLAWLTARLARPIVRARVAALDELDADVIVHAAGLGARALADDPALTGLAGQVVITEPGDVALDVSITDDRTPEMFYVIPRAGSLVLGGCAIPDEGFTEDATLTARILADAARLGLRPGAVIAVRTGLRPFRPEVRLERTGRVIHCYGHGGAGFTLSIGCAEDVASLI